MKVKIIKDQSDQIKLELFSENEEDISDLKKLILVDKLYKERYSFSKDLNKISASFEFSGFENHDIQY